MRKENLAIAKIVDKIKLYEKTGKQVSTCFLDPAELIDAEAIISKVPNCCFGGFENAERKIILFGTEEVEKVKDWIAVIRIESNKKLSHREVLGSILGLGLKREVIGDILISFNLADIFVTREIAKYIIQNLDRIGREKVKVSINNFDNILSKEENTKELKTTVASLRIDAIISSGIGVSREMSSKLIENQKVKLNYKMISNSAKKINVGDKISIRGYGRIELVEVLGETRKDRIRVILRIY